MKKFYNYKDLVERYGVCKTTIYHWYTKGSFPKPVNLGGTNKALWRVEELEEWEKKQGEAA